MKRQPLDGGNAQTGRLNVLYQTDRVSAVSSAELHVHAQVLGEVRCASYQAALHCRNHGRLDVLHTSRARADLGCVQAQLAMSLLQSCAFLDSGAGRTCRSRQVCFT
eukprot:scpid94461/ scgid13559/ 